MNPKALRKILNACAGVKVLVVGDLMLDAYLEGVVQRISPEAPVPVVHHKNTFYRLGGAGNVALGLKSLGAQVSVASVVGGSAAKSTKTLLALLRSQGLSEERVIREPKRSTSVKTRVIANRQQLLRIDEEETTALSPRSLKRLLSESELATFDGVIFSDYAKGVLEENTLRSFLSLAAGGEKPYLALDPKFKHFPVYKALGEKRAIASPPPLPKFSLMTPNHHEAGAMVGRRCETEAELLEVGRCIFEEYPVEQLIITRGEQGMALFEGAAAEPYFLPTVSRSVFDVSGAGDTVIAVFVAAYLAGGTFKQAAQLANLAAGVAVSKFGTKPVTKAELAEQLAALKNE